MQFFLNKIIIKKNNSIVDVLYSSMQVCASLHLHALILSALNLHGKYAPRQTALSPRDIHRLGLTQSLDSKRKWGLRTDGSSQECGALSETFFFASFLDHLVSAQGVLPWDMHLLEPFARRSVMLSCSCVNCREKEEKIHGTVLSGC